MIKYLALYEGDMMELIKKTIDWDKSLQEASKEELLLLCVAEMSVLQRQVKDLRSIVDVGRL